MSILVMSQVWAHSKAEGSTLLCALAIADFANDRGEAFPSVNTLAEKCRISERSVQYAVAKLVELGELEIEPNAGRSGTNLYRIRVQILQGANFAGVQNTTERGATGCTQTVINRQDKKKNMRVREEMSDGQVRLHVDPSLLESWSEAFPAINPAQEVARAELWLNANPANRKSNYERFLLNWMTRAQDRAPRLSSSMATPQVAGRVAESFRERDERLARERYEQAIGKRRPMDPNVIDVTPQRDFLELTHEPTDSLGRAPF